MAKSEAVYFKVPSDDADSQRRFPKVSIALIGGSCLAVLSVVAILAWSPVHSSTGSVESTSLFGMRASLRSAAQPNSLLSSPIGTRLPGSGLWKDATLATMEAANGCARDVSMNANGINAAMARMSSTDRAVVAQASEAVTVKAQEFLKAGQVAPLGFWDPAGFSTDISQGKLLYYREAEIKHGRVCMLAFLGSLVGEQVHPLLGGTDVSGFAHAWTTPPVGYEAFWIAAFLQNFIGIAYLELQNSAPTLAVPATPTWPWDKSGGGGDAFAMKDLTRVPGDFGFDPLGLKPKTEKDLMEMQNKELLNGRLAIIAVVGLMAQEAVTGKHVFR